MTSEDRNLPGLVRRIGIASWSFLGLFLLLVAVGWILLQLRILLAPLVLAAVLVYILDPVVTRLHHHHVPRILGAVLSYLVLVGLLVLLGIVLVPQISQQTSDLASDLPTIYDDVATAGADLLSGIGIVTTNLAFADNDDLPHAIKCTNHRRGVACLMLALLPEDGPGHGVQRHQ